MGNPQEARILDLIRPHLRWALGFSVAINLLFLVSPLYMLQVYDRVLTTGSVATLVVLTGIAVFLLGVYLFAEAGRRRVLARAGEELSEQLAEPALCRGLESAAARPGETVAAVGHLTQVQQALSQGLPGVLFDLPFVPLFLGILFLVHPALGVIGVAGSLGLVGLAVVQERLTRNPLAEARKADSEAQAELAQLVRQRGAIVGMGMAGRAAARWFRLRRRSVETSLRAGAPAVFLGAATRSLRMILQVAILGAGAFLAVRGQVSAGAIIAASIILGRGLAPIDQLVNGWRQLAGARHALRALAAWMGPAPVAQDPVPTPMPRPDPILRLDELSIGIPGEDRPLLAPMEHRFERGRIIALLGSSGSGKTSLLQTLAGAWPPHDGTARLGERDLARWHPEDRGRYTGYLPQHVELLRGTVRENIARFANADPADVFDAARSVGCHELILGLPDGYDTRIGEGGVHLSAGQRQAVGLARAFFRDPPLLLLDEPTAHLDAALAASLMQRIAAMARMAPADRIMTAIIATHDMRFVSAADDIMVIRDRKATIVPRAAYLAQISQLRRSLAGDGQRPQTPLTVDLGGGGPAHA